MTQTASDCQSIAPVLQWGLPSLLVSGMAHAADSPDAKSDLPETILPAVTVEAAAEPQTATGPVQGYIAERSATGAKTDTPIIETPQSISVIGAEEIKTRKADNLMDAIGYTTGIGRVEGADRTSESFLLRGFSIPPQNGGFYRDGTKYSANSYDGLQEPHGLERIELLKGASSVLYGAAAPGGIREYWNPSAPSNMLDAQDPNSMPS